VQLTDLYPCCLELRTCRREVVDLEAADNTLGRMPARRDTRCEDLEEAAVGKPETHKALVLECAAQPEHVFCEADCRVEIGRPRPEPRKPEDLHSKVITSSRIRSPSHVTRSSPARAPESATQP